jgi:hypothetical protein
VLDPQIERHSEPTETELSAEMTTENNSVQDADNGVAPKQNETVPQQRNREPSQEKIVRNEKGNVHKESLMSTMQSR